MTENEVTKVEIGVLENPITFTNICDPVSPHFLIPKSLKYGISFSRVCGHMLDKLIFVLFESRPFLPCISYHERH